MSMKVAVVTGSNSGLGLGIVHSLITRYQNYHVVMACRSVAKAQAAKEELIKEIFPLVEKQKKKKEEEKENKGKNNKKKEEEGEEGEEEEERELLREELSERISVLALDLADLASVFRAAKDLHKRFTKIDVFYANAGVFHVSGKVFLNAFHDMLFEGLGYFFTTGGSFLVQPVGLITKDGYGDVFTSNLFGHYVLIHEIKDLLEDGGKIVWSCSHSARRKYFDFDDIQHLKGPTPYQSSKFATDLVSVALNKTMNNRQIYSFNTAPGLVISTLSYMMIPAILWTFVIPFLVLFRIFIPTLCLDSESGSESNIMVGMHEHPEQLDTNVQYESMVKFEGSNLLTGKGAKRFVSQRPLPEVKVDDAMRLYGILEKMRADAEKFRPSS